MLPEKAIISVGLFLCLYLGWFEIDCRSLQNSPKFVHMFPYTPRAILHNLLNSSTRAVFHYQVLSVALCVPTIFLNRHSNPVKYTAPRAVVPNVTSVFLPCYLYVYVGFVSEVRTYFPSLDFCSCLFGSWSTATASFSRRRKVCVKH